MKRTTYFESFMHFSKNVFGAGIFSIGTAFKDAGLAVAIVILTFEALMIAHCVHLLIQSLDAAVELNNAKLDALEVKEGTVENEEIERDSREVSFPGMARLIFEDTTWNFKLKLGKSVDMIMKILICVQYLGNCSLYIIFVGKMLKRILDSFDMELDVHITMAMAAVPMGCLGLVPSVKGIAIISGVGNAFFVVTFIIVNYYLIDRIQNKERKTIVMVGKPTTIPILFGVVLFAFETVATAFPLRTAMKDPSQLRAKFGIINMGFSFGYVLVLAMGILSYIAYGDTLKDTILMDLPSNETAARIAFFTVALHIMSAYSVNLYVPYKILWSVILVRHGPFKRSWIWDNLLRLVLIICSLIVAEALPYIDLTLSLIGCICATWLTLFLGPLLNILINKHVLEGSRKKINKIKNIIIMILAMFIFVIGCTFTTLQIVYAIMDDFGYGDNKKK